MSKWEIDFVIQFDADDIDAASDRYDEIYDILSEQGYEPVEAEISHALTIDND